MVSANAYVVCFFTVLHNPNIPVHQTHVVFLCFIILHRGEDTFTDTGPVFQEIYAALEANRDTIPHTYHWGQNFPVNSNWVKRSYGSDLEKWQAQRAILLDDGARDIFSNDVIEALGIHE